MYGKYFLFFVIFSQISFLFSKEKIYPLSLDSFFTNKDIKRVLNGEIITRMSIKFNAWNENTDLNIFIPPTEYANEDFSKYEMISDEKAFIPYRLTDDSKLKFYNTLISYSKLKGMKYYSRRIGQVQELIVDAYRVDSDKKKKKIDDEIFTSIPNYSLNYFFQEDNKFGKLVFKSEIYNIGNNFVLINTCTQPMVYLVFVNKKEEFKFITYFIYDEVNGGFFYYSVNPIRIRIDIALKKLSPTTFSNRLRGSTIHLAKLLGLDLEDKYNPWDPEKLSKGEYRNY